jgi:hypothetical protein
MSAVRRPSRRQQAPHDPGLVRSGGDARFLGRQALVHLAPSSGDQRAVPRQQVSPVAAATVGGRSLA